jgi:hypothetical protein
MAVKPQPAIEADIIFDGDQMSERRKRGQRKGAGLTCGQMLLLLLLVVVIGLGAAIAFGYSLGIFDRFIKPGTTAMPSISTPDAHETKQALNPTEMAIQTDALVVTQDPGIVASSTLPVTETFSTPATATVTSTLPPTAPADVCAQLDLRYLNATSNVTVWQVNNPSGQSFTLSRIEISWPATNDAIFNAFLDGNVIWSGVDQVSPTFITSWFGERSDRTVDSSSRLEFFFGTTASESGYDLMLEFENGCEVSGSN